MFLGIFGWILGIHHLQRSRSWRWNRPNSWVMWNIGTFANPWNHQEVQIDMDVYDVNIEKYSKTTPLNSWSRPNSSGNWERSFSARMYCLPGTSWGMAKTGVFHVQNHPASLDMRGALQHVVPKSFLFAFLRESRNLATPQRTGRILAWHAYGGLVFDPPWFQTFLNVCPNRFHVTTLYRQYIIRRT